jgi:hypothetical protein
MNKELFARSAGVIRRLIATTRNSRLAVAVSVIAVLAVSAGFAWSPEGDDEISLTAIDHFWAAYHGNRYDAIPQVEAELQQAILSNPNNPTLYALLGAAHFWHIGEAARDTNPHDPALGQDMPAAVSNFGQALALDYYTKHFIGYINDDHLPGYLGITTVHLGQMTGDQSLIARGDQMLDFAVYEFAEFNNFNRWAADNTESKDSPRYQKALDSLWQGLDACVGTTVDRANPDLKPYLNVLASVVRKKTCRWDGELAPYSFEGYMLNLGNGLVKAGQIEAARVMYNNAHYAANYSTWPYRNVLESIENSDLSARAALYTDNNPNNDPPLGVPYRGCAYCHAKVPEPSGESK